MFSSKTKKSKTLWYADCRVVCIETGLGKPMLTLKDPNGLKNTTNIYSIHLALRKALPCQINTGKRKYVNPCLPPLQWRHNGRAGVSNHQLHDCLLNRLFRHRSNKIAKLRVTDLCEGNPSVTSEFPTQMASNAENVSIWWRYHANEHGLINTFWARLY